MQTGACPPTSNPALPLTTVTSPGDVPSLASVSFSVKGEMLVPVQNQHAVGPQPVPGASLAEAGRGKSHRLPFLLQPQFTAKCVSDGAAHKKTSDARREANGTPVGHWLPQSQAQQEVETASFPPEETLPGFLRTGGGGRAPSPPILNIEANGPPAICQPLRGQRV